jgi:DNA-binding NtrC family response regulator
MDVLIIERDVMLAAVLADSLAEDGVATVVLHNDKEALALPQQSVPRVVITGINRNGEDMRGLAIGRALRARFPFLAMIYMAALWPARLHRSALARDERFLAKPVRMSKLVETVRELLTKAMRPAILRGSASGQRNLLRLAEV